jgi:hypothetical protein
MRFAGSPESEEVGETMEEIMHETPRGEARAETAEASAPALALRVRTMSGAEFYLPAVPPEATAAEVVAQLEQQGVVPPPPTAQAYELAVGEGAGFRRLDGEQSLGAAGVRSGAALLLVSNAPGAAPVLMCASGAPEQLRGPERRIGSRGAQPPHRLVIRRVRSGPPPVAPEPTPGRIETAWRGAALRVYMDEGAMEDVWRSVGRCPKCGRPSPLAGVERGGALVGTYATTALGRLFVKITDVIPAREAPSSSCLINIRVEDWLQIMHRQRTELPSRHLVGWYHSQPGLGVDMSWVDLRTQRALFGADWQIALVVDPLSGDYRFYRGPKARCVRWLAFVRAKHGRADHADDVHRPEEDDACRAAAAAENGETEKECGIDTAIARDSAQPGTRHE